LTARGWPRGRSDPGQFSILRSVGAAPFLAEADPRQEVPAVIRIQLVAMDTMLSDMITDLLATEPDIAVVGRSANVSQAMGPRGVEAPDVLLLQDGRSGEGLVAAALARKPPAILCIVANGREGWTLRLAAERQPIEAAEGGLAAAVRRAAGHPGANLRRKEH
jgi:hypothetical protein